MTAKAWRPLPHTFDELALQHDWPRTCEHCGIVVYGPGATHCPQRVLDAIAVAEAERDAALAVLGQLVAALSTWRADEPASETTQLWQQRHDAMDAARRLLAGGK